MSAPTFNPAKRLISMAEAEALLISWGGAVRRNGCTELVFSHPFMEHPVTTNAIRRQTSDRLTAWLRQLEKHRAMVREAFELEEAS